MASISLPEATHISQGFVRRLRNRSLAPTDTPASVSAGFPISQRTVSYRNDSMSPRAAIYDKLYPAETGDLACCWALREVWNVWVHTIPGQGTRSVDIHRRFEPRGVIQA
jgi:hypothetical protein